MKTKLLIKTAYCGCLLLLVSALCATPASGQSKKKVAVYVTGEADAATKKVIGAKMVSAITKDDEYAAVERTADFLAELSKEQNYQRSGAVDDNQITQLGRQFGVAFVCIADISNLYGSLFVAARMINVQTGLVTATAERDKEISGMADLTELSDDVADGLINNVAPCNKKDKPVDKKGCCAGLTDIAGVCRDLSGDLYWITGCPRYFWAKHSPKVTADVYVNCPKGYRVADAADIKCLYQDPYGRSFIGTSGLWTEQNPSKYPDAGDNRVTRLYWMNGEVKRYMSYARKPNWPTHHIEYGFLCVRQ